MEAQTKPERETVLTAEKATLLFQGGIGYTKMEVRDLRIAIGPYAQYARGIYVDYVPKGKRSRRGSVFSTYATLVVLDGWGHTLEPAGGFGPAKNGVRESRHSFGSEAWGVEFTAALAGYLATNEIKALADYHGHEPGSRGSY